MKIFKIFKQVIPPNGVVIKNCVAVLSAHNQREEICVWFYHDISTQHSVHVIDVPTGEEWPDDYEFRGTVLLENGDLVFHVFYKFIQ